MTLDITVPDGQNARGDAPRDVGAGRLRPDGRGGDGAARTRSWSTPWASDPAFEFSTSPPVPATSHCRPPARVPTSVSTDLTPELLRRSQARAAEQGFDADATGRPTPQALPFGDGEFDAVLSAIGVMFAPDHQVRRRRAGPGVPARRDDRRDQLDPRGILRPDAGRHQALPTEPVGGDTDVGVVGSRALRQRTAGKSGARRQNAAGRVGGEPVRQRRGRPRLLQESLRPDDRGLPRTSATTRRWPPNSTPQLIELARQYLADGAMEWEYLLVTATKR